MNRSPVLVLDAVINLVLGAPLIVFRAGIAEFFGIPVPEQSFYPSVLGAVLFGIGIALLVEYLGKPKGLVGLGLGGAVAINLSAGVVLAGWLVSGELEISVRGHAFLWALVVVVVAVSGIELHVYRRRCAAFKATA